MIAGMIDARLHEADRQPRPHRLAGEHVPEEQRGTRGSSRTPASTRAVAGDSVELSNKCGQSSAAVFRPKPSVAPHPRQRDFRQHEQRDALDDDERAVWLVT